MIAARGVDPIVVDRRTREETVQLNAVEKALMNNPARAALQRRYETRLLRRLGGALDGGKALEVGCGRGVGAEIIVDRFGAAVVDGFDVDPTMVDRARRRLARRGGRARVWVGDATSIDAPDAAYDAVFDFAIVHHVPEWRTAVAEIARVLRPGGRFYFEEVTSHALDRWSYRTFLDHPEEDRFSGAEFVEGCEQAGLVVGDRWVERFFGDFVIGVATRASGASPQP
jgi:ubiquinone/menaquinone biosynthesis C-methylase UbiE